MDPPIQYTLSLSLILFILFDTLIFNMAHKFYDDLYREKDFLFIKVSEDFFFIPHETFFSRV